jgi:hypothetical protein
MTSEDAADVTAHLAGCDACRHTTVAEERTDEILARAMRAVPEPTGLRDRLLARLARERRRWYRRLDVRIAAAAAVLLAVGVGIWCVQPGPAPVNLAELAARLERMPTNAEQAELALSAPGRPVQVPDDFNYGLLVHCGPTQFQGRLTPTLDFQTVDARPGAPVVYHARIYILSDSQFDLKALESHSLAPAGPYNIEIRRSLDGRTAYLIVFTGGRLDPFLKPGGTPA